MPDRFRPRRRHCAACASAEREHAARISEYAQAARHQQPESTASILATPDRVSEATASRDQGRARRAEPDVYCGRQLDRDARLVCGASGPAPGNAAGAIGKNPAGSGPRTPRLAALRAHWRAPHFDAVAHARELRLCQRPRVFHEAMGFKVALRIDCLGVQLSQDIIKVPDEAMTSEPLRTWSAQTSTRCCT